MIYHSNFLTRPSPLDSEPPLPELYGLYITVFVLASVWNISFAIFALIVLLICSALISGSEVAYFSLSPQEVHDINIDKEPSSRRIQYLRSIPAKLLATILIVNNLVNIAIVMVSNYISLNALPDTTFISWSRATASWPLVSSLSIQARADGINFVITTVFVTFLLVLFGEVAPKIYAKLNNVRLARFMSQPLILLVRFFSPFSALLVSWGNSIETRLKSTSGSRLTDKDEIDKAIDLAVSSENVSVEESRIEADILKSIIKFNDVSVKQIMRARVDVIAVDKSMPYDELMQLITSSGYSRIPVYEDDFDNILGILYVKDLIRHRHEGTHFQWQKLVRTSVLYVPESKKINDVLKEFQAEKVHIAVVVDEYGGAGGIVTLEDVMEEVIGDIRDEFDDDREGDYKKIDDTTYVFDGKMLINDACRIMDIDSSALDVLRGDADSLAGLILEMNGEMPNKGEEFNIEGMHVIVLSVSKRRIEKLRVKRPEDEE